MKNEFFSSNKYRIGKRGKDIKPKIMSYKLIVTDRVRFMAVRIQQIKCM